MLTEFLAGHPFLARDLRRLRKRGRLLRFLFLPAAALLLVWLGLNALRPELGIAHRAGFDLDMLILVSAIHAMGILAAGDPLGGWREEIEALRVEALRLLPITPRALAIRATERRFFLKLLLSLAFLPFYLYLYATTQLTAATLAGVYLLLAVAAWMLAPLSAVELLQSRAADTTSGGRFRQGTQARGWPVALFALLYLGFGTCVFHGAAQQHSLDGLVPAIGQDTLVMLRYFPLDFALTAARYGMHLRPFFGLSLPPVLWILALAYLVREIRILGASRVLRSEIVTVTRKDGQSQNIACPPVDRQREDRAARKLQIVRGLLVRLVVIGAAWPLIRTAGSTGLTTAVLVLIGLGSLVGLQRAWNGARSILLPGRLEAFLQQELPDALRSGAVIVPPLAAAVVAEAIGWEIIAAAAVCIAAGALPALSPLQVVGALVLVAVSFLAAEAAAVGYTLSWLPAASKREQSPGLWASGALLSSANLPSRMVLLLVYALPLFLPVLLAAYPGDAPLTLVSPFGGWLWIITGPATYSPGLTLQFGEIVALLALPGLIALLYIWMILSSDRRRQAALSDRSPEAAVKAPRLQSPAAALRPELLWVLGLLDRWAARRNSAFVNLELARLRRKSLNLAGQVWLPLILGAVIWLMFACIGVIDYCTQHGVSFLSLGPVVLFDRVEIAGMNMLIGGWAALWTGIIALGMTPFLCLCAAASLVRRDWKASRSSGSLAFLLATPLTNREVLLGTVEGKTFSQLPIALTGMASGGACILAALLSGATAWGVAWAAASFAIGLLIGVYSIATASAYAGPEKWRPWVVGVVSVLPFYLYPLFGSWIAGDFYLGNPLLTEAAIASLLAFMTLLASAGWFALGRYGIRVERLRDYGSQAPA